MINFFTGSKVTKLPNDKPVISFPSNFEHTVHVGFDPHTGEFTVSKKKIVFKDIQISRMFQCFTLHINNIIFKFTMMNNN